MKLISRKKALNIIREMELRQSIYGEGAKEWHEYIDKQTRLLPVTEIKKGKWVLDSTEHVEPIYRCSRCGDKVWGDSDKTPYCSMCGAKMKGAKI